MMKRTLLSVGILITIYLCISTFLSFAQEKARHLHEDDQYCESYQTLKWTSYFLDEAKAMVGSLLSRGRCVNQNISEAIRLYTVVYNGNPSAETFLFYDAIEEAEASRRLKQEINSTVIVSLFLEAKNRGYSPDEKAMLAMKDAKLEKQFNAVFTLP